MSVVPRACVAVRVSDKYPPLFSKHRNTVSVASVAYVATLAKEFGMGKPVVTVSCVTVSISLQRSPTICETALCNTRE